MDECQINVNENLQKLPWKNKLKKPPERCVWSSIFIYAIFGGLNMEAFDCVKSIKVTVAYVTWISLYCN